MRAVQTVGAKGDMFGLADGGSVVAGVSKGAPVKAVMAITNSSPYSLAVRADAGIKTLKDIEGKTIASAPGEAGLQLLPGLFARNGVDIDKVKILRVEGAGKDGGRRRKARGRPDGRARQPVADVAQAGRPARSISPTRSTAPTPWA